LLGSDWGCPQDHSVPPVGTSFSATPKAMRKK
jgi:hypothetical protein